MPAEERGGLHFPRKDWAVEAEAWGALQQAFLEPLISEERGSRWAVRQTSRDLDCGARDT